MSTVYPSSARMALRPDVIACSSSAMRILAFVCFIRCRGTPGPTACQVGNVIVAPLSEMSRWTPALYAAETTSSLSANLDPSRSPQETLIAGPPASSAAEQTTSFDASTAAKSTAAIARRAADVGALVVPRRSTPLSTVSRLAPPSSASAGTRATRSQHGHVARDARDVRRSAGRPRQGQHRFGRLDHRLQLGRRGLGERPQRRGCRLTPPARCATARPPDSRPRRSGRP